MHDVALLLQAIHHLHMLAQAAANWLFPAIGLCSGVCATCACASGNCMSAGGAAAGAGAASAAGAGGAAGDGDDKSKPHKVFPLPGGGWFGTDGRVHYGAEGEVSVSVHTPAGDIPLASGSVGAKADAGAAPGADPHGNIADLNWQVNVGGSVGPLQGSYSQSGNVSVRISNQVQQNISGPMGHVGTQSGAWLNQYMNSNEP